MKDAEAFVSYRLCVTVPRSEVKPFGPAISPFIKHLAAQGYEVIAWQYDQPPDRLGYVIRRLKARPAERTGEK